MSQYIDGFVFPIPRSQLSEYQGMASAVAELWREHGALDYCEYLGDDLSLEGTRPFNDVLNSSDDDVIVFGYAVFASRAARDAVNEKVAGDPRIAKIMAAGHGGFDAARMAYGGFARLI